MDKSQRFGTTEISDPCFHLEIFENLYDGNLIIAKRLTPALIDKLKIVWWYCAGREAASKDVPATMDMPGMYLVSGFDGSILQLLLGTKVDEKTGKTVSMTMEESVNAALTQEVLTLVQ